MYKTHEYIYIYIYVYIYIYISSPDSFPSYHKILSIGLCAMVGPWRLSILYIVGWIY